MRVRALGYVGVESPEAKQWEEFGPEILGLQRVDGDRPGSVYLRMDERHHRLAVHPGPKDRLAYLGWEMAGDDDLAEAAEELGRSGYGVTEGTDDECEERAVRRVVSVTDPGGARHEFFYGQLSLPGQFHAAGSDAIHVLDAGDVGDHGDIGLRIQRVARVFVEIGGPQQTVAQFAWSAASPPSVGGSVRQWKLNFDSLLILPVGPISAVYRKRHPGVTLFERQGTDKCVGVPLFAAGMD